MPACTPEQRDFRKKKWLEVYKNTFNRAEACTSVRLNRATLWRWLKADRNFNEAVMEIEESALDEAESKLIELVRGGNLQAIKFLLRTKGRTRGYGDHLEIAQTVKQETIDTKRLEILLSDSQTREALEVLAVESLKTNPKEVEIDRQIEYRNY
jgi:hypothetical protein